MWVVVVGPENLVEAEVRVVVVPERECLIKVFAKPLLDEHPRYAVCSFTIASNYSSSYLGEVNGKGCCSLAFLVACRCSNCVADWFRLEVKRGLASRRSWRDPNALEHRAVSTRRQRWRLRDGFGPDHREDTRRTSSNAVSSGCCERAGRPRQSRQVNAINDRCTGRRQYGRVEETTGYWRRPVQDP